MSIDDVTAAGWKARPDHPDYLETRERLVAAAEELLARDGVRRFRLDRVAAVAGVHRSSVYRYFDTKEDLICEAWMQSTLRVGQQVIASLDGRDDPAVLLVEGLVRGMAAVATDPVHRSLIEPAASEAVARISGRALAEGLRPLVEPALAAAAERGVLRPGVTADDGMRWMMLVTSGLVRSPTIVADEDDLRELLTKMLIPALINAE